MVEMAPLGEEGGLGTALSQILALSRTDSSKARPTRGASSLPPPLRLRSLLDARGRPAPLLPLLHPPAALLLLHLLVSPSEVPHLEEGTMIAGTMDGTNVVASAADGNLMVLGGHVSG